MKNWKDSYRGVVHLGTFGGGGEYTLCGFAYDEPASEHNAEVMVETSDVCTCEHCLLAMRNLLPYLKRESRRIAKRKAGRKDGRKNKT